MDNMCRSKAEQIQLSRHVPKGVCFLAAAAYVLSFRLTCSEPSTYCIKYRDGSLHDTFTLGMMVVVTSVLAILGYWRASILFAAGEGNEEIAVKLIGNQNDDRPEVAIFRGLPNFHRPQRSYGESV
jgi:hypothetical protein